MGMAEQSLVGSACGLARTGYVPFATTYAVFATRRAYDLPLPLAIATVELLSAVTDRAGKLVSEGLVDVDSATELCVELITGGLAGLNPDRPLKA